MRIYAVADIHGHSGRLAFIRSNIINFKPDVLVVAGDITGYFHPRPVIEKLNAMPVRVLAVRGNSDLKRVDALFECFENVTSLHLTEQAIGGVSFTGLSGTIPIPFRSRISFREREILKQMTRLVNRSSVLVAHAPPWGELDRVVGRLHAGSRGLRQLILKTRPGLVICGHIHEDIGTAHINETLVVNCSIGRSRSGVVIDQEDSGKWQADFI